MKKILTFILVLNFYYCTDSTHEEKIDNSSNEYLEITDNLSCQEFEKIKDFILNYGDKQTYRNYDNNNPHYSFEGFECYLNAEIGQGNINNDPLISDFNQITIQNLDSNIKYYYLQIVREGDLNKSEIQVLDGMKEGKVYLLNYYENDLDLMKDNLLEYIEVIMNEIDKHL